MLQNPAVRVVRIDIEPVFGPKCCRCQKRQEQTSRIIAFESCEDADTVFSWFEQRVEKVQFAGDCTLRVPLCYDCTPVFKRMFAEGVRDGITRERIQQFLAQAV